MQRLVVVVDTQADFMWADGALSVAGAEALIAPMQRWLSSLRPAETAGGAVHLRHPFGRGLSSLRSEEHTSELQSLMRISYAVFCLKKQMTNTEATYTHSNT